MPTKMKLGLLVFALLFVNACDSDPFGFNKATVLGSYKLEKPEVGTHFYLIGPGPQTGYGVLESTVGKIGWNDRYILVWQTADGLRSGWRIVDSKQEVVSDYISAEEAEEDPRVRGIRVIAPGEAWKQLK